MVPVGLQKIWQQSGPGRADPSISAGDSRDSVASNLLGVISRENRTTRGPAPGGVVEPGEAKSAFRQFVQIRRVDFAAVATKVRESEVIGQQKEDIWPGRGTGRRADSGADQGEHSQTGIHMATPGDGGKGPCEMMGLGYPNGFDREAPSTPSGTECVDQVPSPEPTKPAWFGSGIPESLPHPDSLNSVSTFWDQARSLLESLNLPSTLLALAVG